MCLLDPKENVVEPKYLSKCRKLDQTTFVTSLGVPGPDEGFGRIFSAGKSVKAK